MHTNVSIKVTRQSDYKFLVDFGSTSSVIADEPPPLGTAIGPSPSQLLAAAVANCMLMSFLFVCQKFKQDPGQLTATAYCELVKNQDNRERVANIVVGITLGVSAEAIAHFDRIASTFEDYCTVTQSVRDGVPVRLTMSGPDGQVLRPPTNGAPEG
jgi:organic hydroperoxide reductase OsmC/OhrA